MRSEKLLYLSIVGGLSSALAGCDSTTGRSKLSGSWYTRELITRTFYPDGRIETAIDKGKIPLVVINEDGTFDWTATMLAMLGEEVKNLRQAGDSITTAEASVSVVKAKYTPRSSEIEMIYTYAGEEPMRTRYRVYLDLFGSPHYVQTGWYSTPSIAGQPRSTLSGRLYRSDPKPRSAPE
jgi:hypothetical protein